MDLDDITIAICCAMDETVPVVSDGHRLCQRGLQPVLAESAVLTLVVVGEHLGIEQDSALFTSFQWHYAHYVSAVRTLHHTTVVRQAANLRRLKEWLWQCVLERTAHDPTCAIIDSFLLLICQLARAYRCHRCRRCRRCRGEAAFSTETLVRPTCYGLRVQVRLGWPGLITHFCVAKRKHDTQTACTRDDGRLEVLPILVCSYPHGWALEPPPACSAQDVLLVKMYAKKPSDTSASGLRHGDVCQWERPLNPFT